jgi:molecular chaperone HtpG
MSRETGNLSIHTENILPIIKKWLYSDKDIFLRELVSNSSDAISKLDKLVRIGEAEIEENPHYSIKVVVNKELKTIQVIDNGIGMTEDEVKKYINQIAFSGAQEFLEKYKDKADEGSQIIGHFGLGFYSAFMVADRVRIDTLSYKKDAEPVTWTSSGGIEYEMDRSQREDRGTSITLYVAEDSQEFLDEYKLREILIKYCSFLPYEIYLEDATKEKKEEQTPINDTIPLWLKNPKDCTDEEYKEFYKKVFFDFNDPLFWVHLNVDYPFNLKGILYFPKLKHEFETMEGQIKLYYNQVFVADNIKEVIPEFLMLLKGTIDCPDLPLNVSRSFLQNDGYVRKISSHITKKVADKLISIFNDERDNYNKYWNDINPFIKYGCIREEKFYDRIKDIIIYKTTNDDYVTLKEYLERNSSKHKNRVFYVTDEKQQAQYIKMFRDHDMEAVVLNTIIDSHFIQFIEMKNTDLKFCRIDADIAENLKDMNQDKEDETAKAERDALETLFKESIGDDNLKVKVESLKSTSIPGVILLEEQSRRIQEMSRMFGGLDMSATVPKEETLVLNRNNELIKSILKLNNNDEKKEDVKMFCQHIYDLAMMSHKQLEPQAMTNFIERSNDILTRLAEG